MIPLIEKTRVVNNLGGVQHKMGMRAEDFAHLRSVLTNLYKDIELACVREYSTNALDAHTEAGIDKPIQVTLPNALTSSLVIEDFGPGMSEDMLTQTYGMYGASSKRGTNLANGMLGLGSKAALSYTDSFTVTSVRNGVKTVVIVHKDADGDGVLDVISSESTDQRSGTRIEIPVKTGQHYIFRNKAAEFFRWWEPGTVLVDGEAPLRLELDDLGVKTADNVWVSSERYASNTITVIMGYVAYQHTMEMDVSGKLSTNIQVHVKVPIGTVDFVPSREALKMTDRTKAFVEKTWNEAVDKFVEALVAEIQSADTYLQAVEIFEKYKNVLKDGSIEWNGYPVKGFVSVDKTFNVRRYSKLSESTSCFEGSMVSHLLGGKWLMVHNAPSKFSREHRLGVDRYLEGTEFTNIVFGFAKSPFPEVIEKYMPSVDWDEIKPHVTTRRKSAKGSSVWEVYVADVDSDGRAFVSHKDSVIPSGVKVVYASPHDLKTYNGRRDMGLVLIRKICVVVVPGNRLSRFNRENPKAVHLSDYIKSETKKIENSLTDGEREFLLVDSRYGSLKSFIDQLKGKTHDPMIDKIAGSYLSATKKTRDYGILVDDRYRPLVTGFGYFRENYPLARIDFMQHSIAYINAIYTSKDV